LEINRSQYSRHIRLVNCVELYNNRPFPGCAGIIVSGKWYNNQFFTAKFNLDSKQWSYELYIASIGR
jgi:hypothetical protein